MLRSLKRNGESRNVRFRQHTLSAATGPLALAVGHCATLASLSLSFLLPVLLVLLAF